MKRRIALLLGTFVTLLLAYLVYHFSTGGLERLVSGPRQVARDRPIVSAPPIATPASGPAMDRGGKGLRIEVRDPKTGMLEGVYFFPRWDKQPDGSYLVEDPNVTIYHKNGERTYVTARWGSIDVEELAKQKWEVRKGDLHGGVTVWFDRNPQGGPPAASHERMRQVVRLYTDDIHLDNERFVMHTDSRVVLFSDKADIIGTGLRVRWRDAPRELVRLEIPRGGQMHVYEVPEEFGASLPGAGAPAGATESPTSRPQSPPRAPSAPSRPAAATGPTSTTSTAASSPAWMAATAASEPTSSAATTPLRAQTQPGSAASSPAASRPAVKPQPPPRSNMYRAEFHGQVKVDYPIVRRESNVVDHGYVDGADVLGLVFEWDANTRRRAMAGGEEDREARRERVAQTASLPATSSAPAGTTAAGEIGRASCRERVYLRV